MKKYSYNKIFNIFYSKVTSCDWYIIKVMLVVIHCKPFCVSQDEPKELWAKLGSGGALHECQPEGPRPKLRNPKKIQI